MRLRCLPEIDTAPDATFAGHNNHIGLRHLKAATVAAGARLKETGGAGDPAAEIEAYWHGLGVSGVLTMMKEHEARKALAMAMDRVQQDSKTAALLMSAGDGAALPPPRWTGSR